MLPSANMQSLIVVAAVRCVFTGRLAQKKKSDYTISSSLFQLFSALL